MCACTTNKQLISLVYLGAKSFGFQLRKQVVLYCYESLRHQQNIYNNNRNLECSLPCMSDHDVQQLNEESDYMGKLPSAFPCYCEVNDTHFGGFDYLLILYYKHHGCSIPSYCSTAELLIINKWLQ